LSHGAVYGEHRQKKKKVSDLGYISSMTRYIAQNCESCSLRPLCYKSKNKKIIEVNHKLNEYKRKTRERLLSEEGIYHRRKRCIEPKAVFEQIKHNSALNRFRLRGLEKVKVEFTLVAIAHNLRKMARKAGLYLLFTRITPFYGLITVKTGNIESNLIQFENNKLAV